VRRNCASVVAHSLCLDSVSWFSSSLHFEERLGFQTVDAVSQLCDHWIDDSSLSLLDVSIVAQLLHRMKDLGRDSSPSIIVRQKY